MLCHSRCVNDQKVRFRVEANPATNGLETQHRNSGNNMRQGLGCAQLELLRDRIWGIWAFDLLKQTGYIKLPRSRSVADRSQPETIPPRVPCEMWHIVTLSFDAICHRFIQICHEMSRVIRWAAVLWTYQGDDVCGPSPLSCFNRMRFNMFQHLSAAYSVPIQTKQQHLRFCKFQNCLYLW